MPTKRQVKLGQILKREHVIEDGLASTGPHIRELMAHRMHFILGVKPGDHAYLFDRVTEAGHGGIALGNSSFS